jgi:NAD(P)-dependent dehydrogenase (short-subunit alcohol dehydrogenase family)
MWDGLEFGKADLAAGNAVVATGRNTDAARTAVGEAEDLLVVKLDATHPQDAEAALTAAVNHVGRIRCIARSAIVNQTSDFTARIELANQSSRDASRQEQVLRIQ